MSIMRFPWPYRNGMREMHDFPLHVSQSRFLQAALFHADSVICHSRTIDTLNSVHCKHHYARATAI